MYEDTGICIFVNTHTYMCLQYVHTYICIYIHTYVYIYIYTHTCLYCIHVMRVPTASPYMSTQAPPYASRVFSTWSPEPVLAALEPRQSWRDLVTHTSNLAMHWWHVVKTGRGCAQSIRIYLPKPQQSNPRGSPTYGLGLLKGLGSPGWRSSLSDLPHGHSTCHGASDPGPDS